MRSTVNIFIFSLRLNRFKKVSPNPFSAAFWIFGGSPILPEWISSRNVSSKVVVVGWLENENALMKVTIHRNFIAMDGDGLFTKNFALFCVLA